MNTPTADLPIFAGKAKLDFLENARMPHRLDDRLVLPMREGMEFHSLKDGEQFLIIYPGTLSIFGRHGGADGRAFFGGTDEAPFITAIEEPAVRAFLNGGERAFFQALVPTPIKIFKEKFPEAPVQRQGDIWSIRLPVTWDDLEKSIISPKRLVTKGKLTRRRRKHAKKQNESRRIEQKNRIRLFGETSLHVRGLLGTQNHEVHGRCVSAPYFEIEEVRLNTFTTALVEGTLSAPDHASQELVGAPHLLARTPHLSPLFLHGGD